MGIKNPDSATIPLCCPRPDVEGCHARQHRIGEEKFYEKHGGIEAAQRLAQDLWENTGNWAACCEKIVRF